MILSLGTREFNKIKKSRQISHDPRYTDPVNRVAKRLQKAIDIPEAEWEFVVFKDNSPNAFALPGGKVGINTGLFRLADNDALLAAALGHEISHATGNHAKQRTYRMIGLVLASAILWQSLDHQDVDHAGYHAAALALAGYLIDSLPFSRKLEYESDRIGAVYMARAGYDPRQAIKLWRNMEHYHALHGGQKNELLLTHPSDQSRIRALENFMPVAMKFYAESQGKGKQHLKH